VLNRNFFDFLSGGKSCRTTLESRRFYLLRRQGHDLLAIPSMLRHSSDALALYLPQTQKARLAKRIFAALLRSRFHFLLPSLRIDINNEPLTDFLASLNNGESTEFAVLSGNPAEPGRRFVLAVVDSSGQYRHAAKCAIDATGGALIEAEIFAIEALTDKFPAIPKISAKLATAECRAFAMDFFREPERSLTRAERITLASKWVWPGASVPLERLTSWRAIAHPDLDTSDVMVRPVVFHGDFAPWNIRRSGDQWMVIDWEKGATHGPPLWDLLHYEIHEEVLVNRSTTQKVRTRIQSLLQDPSLQPYLANCKASQHSDLLLQGYLSHLDTIYPNIRGRKTVDELIASYRP